MSESCCSGIRTILPSPKRNKTRKIPTMIRPCQDQLFTGPASPSRYSVRSRKLGQHPLPLLGERILRQGKLLAVNRQPAPRGRDELRVNRAVDIVRDEMEAAVAH